MVGLEIVIFINELICVVFVYMLVNICLLFGENKVMIFDFGGGFLDVILFSIEEDVIEVKVISGDS